MIRGVDASADAIRVRRQVSRFRRRVGAEALLLYRKHLQTTVTRTSPLVGVVAREERIDLCAALSRLEPPHGWPDARRRGFPGTPYSRLLRQNADDHVHDLGGLAADRILRIKGEPHAEGSLMLRVADGALEVSARISGVWIRTRLGTIELRLPMMLPDILTSVTGRPISTLVGHPWFSDPAWIIEDVWPARGAVTMLRVSAAYESFAMPWRRLLGRDAG